MKSLKSSIQAFKKYSSIQVFKYRVYKLVSYLLRINNVKSRDPLGFKNNFKLWQKVYKILQSLMILYNCQVWRNTDIRSPCADSSTLHRGQVPWPHPSCLQRATGWWWQCDKSQCQQYPIWSSLWSKLPTILQQRPVRLGNPDLVWRGYLHPRLSAWQYKWDLCWSCGQCSWEIPKHPSSSQCYHNYQWGLPGCL